MSMTKKDYELIAKVINKMDARDSHNRENMRTEIAIALGQEFLYENHRFNLVKFLDACDTRRTV